jgi:hypothetical protein
MFMFRIAAITANLLTLILLFNTERIIKYTKSYNIYNGYDLHNRRK